MAVTILEALQNADYNLQKNGMIGLAFVKWQLHNATVLLEKGYSLYEEIDPILEKYPNIEEAPEKESVR